MKKEQNSLRIIPIFVISFFVAVQLKFFIQKRELISYLFRIRKHLEFNSIFVEFLIKYILFYVFFSYLIFKIASLIQKNKQIILALVVIFYPIVYCVQYYPQILIENFPLFGFWLYGSVDYLNVNLSLLFSGTLIVAVFVSNLVFYKKNKRSKYILTGALFLFLIIINNPVFNFNFAPYSQLQGAANKNKNIIMIGIDGLSPEHFYKLNFDNYPYLKNFLNNSTKFTNAITNLARTQPTYVSILNAMPVEKTKARFSMSNAAFNTDLLLEESPLVKLKGKYTTSFLTNNSTFGSFRIGKVFDEVDAPSISNFNEVIPLFFKDILFFSLLNNRVGELLFPEIFLNGAFFETYWPARYTEKLISKISNFNLLKPQFLVSHFVKLHWPGSTQYPYLPKADRANSTVGNYTEFTYEGLNKLVRSRNELKNNQYLYELGLKQTIEQVLEPTFKFLYESRIIESSTVILLSDHSESFFEKELYPYSKVPSHGAIMGVSSSANRVLLQIKDEGIKTNKVEDIFPLYKLLRLINAGIPLESGDDGEVALETDTWYQERFPGEIYIKPNIKDNFNSDSNSKVTVFNEVWENLQTILKIRGILVNNKIIYFIPSKMGPYLIAREFDTDSQADLSTSDVRQAVLKFKKKYKSDIRNNLFYIDNFFKIKKDEKLAKSEISHCRKNTLCLLYKALYNLNDKVDLLAAERELTELLGDENIDVSIRIIAAESYFHGCMLSTRYFNELPKFNLKSERVQILSEICAIKKGQISYNESKFKDVMNQSRIDFELLKYKKLLSQHEVIFFPFNEIFLKFSSSLRTKQIDLDDLRTDAIAIENNHFLCDGDFSIFLMLEEQEKITTMKIDSIFNNLNSISTVGLVQLNQIIDKTYVSSHYSSEFDIDRLGIQTREYLRKKWLKVKSSVKSK